MPTNAALQTPIYNSPSAERTQPPLMQSHKLIAKIKIEIKQRANNDDELLSLLSEQMSYERIKKILSERLGRIILK